MDGIDKSELMKNIFAGNGDMIHSSERLERISTDKLVDFHTGDEGHVFDVEYDDDMKELEARIEADGRILEPITVRKDKEYPGKYEVISGHRRKYIGIKRGQKDFLCVIMDIDDEDAIKLMIASNLDKRKKIKPSNLARAYKAYMDANKRQGQRNDLTSSQVETKLRTDDKAAEKFKMSRATIQRILRLYYLIPELSDLVDNGKIKQGIGVELSYLSQQAQTDVYLMISVQKQKITLEKAEMLHRLADSEGELSVENITAVMIKPKKTEEKLTDRSVSKMLPQYIKKSAAETKLQYIKEAIRVYDDYLKSHPNDAARWQ